MASIHASSSLARTRSARVPPLNSGKPVLGTSRVLSSASSISSTAPSAPAVAPTNVSNLSLFLTNLRLLDLDLYPDWPDICASTFSTRDAAQGQKKRIQCVEWALYRLFALWDPDEARDKLQPFFPPLDQVQSLNLRAALLRCLEHAKKNGVLGRDAVIRKTMLDECKGERLEEVLAAFSSAVLKKLVAEQQLNEPQRPPLAQALALEHRGYSGDRGELQALILAHKVSLTQSLGSKNRSRARYNDFSQLMKVKEKGIARRRAQFREAQEERQEKQAISDDLKVDVWRTVRNNWSGNERWMETLLYGDSQGRKDGLLSTPFDRVWRRVETDRLAELEDKSGGLLEQLDDRVKSQKQRLEKWQDFRHRMFGKAALETRMEETSSRPSEKGIDLGFRAHESLHLNRLSPRKLAPVNPIDSKSEYGDLVQSLKAEMASLGAEKFTMPPFFQRPQKSSTSGFQNSMDLTGTESEAVSDLSEIEDEPLPLPTRPSPPRQPVKAIEHVLRRAASVRFEPSPLSGEQPDFPHLRRSATLQSKRASVSRRPPSVSPTRSPERAASPPPRLQHSPPSRVLHSPPQLAWSPPRATAVPAISTASPERTVSPTQQLAEQILASVNAASPSPIKKPRHTLSLAERTRLSMARRASNLPAKSDEYGDESEMDRLPIRRGPMVSIDPPASPEGQHENRNSLDADADAYEDLESRTRRSMVGFEAAQKKAQLERRRSLRKGKNMQPPAGRGSIFPAVDEEENTTLLLAEEFMNSEVDQDTVFMSRPKIKTSPVGTPVRGSIWDD